MRRLLATGALAAICAAACSDGRRAEPPADPPLVLAEHAGKGPPAPAQWAGTAEGVPTNQWWSSALVGPGTEQLWPQPLAAQITRDGALVLSHEPAVRRTDGTANTEFRAALTIRAEGASQTTVVDSGALHVTLAVGDAHGEAFRVTLAQGSPFAELSIHRAVMITGAGPAAGAGSFEFAGGTARWIGGLDGARAEVRGDTIAVTPERATGAIAAGPIPRGAAGDWAAHARDAARHPLRATAEALRVDRHGAVTQTLTYDRGGRASVVALLPHHQSRLARRSGSLGSFEIAAGTLDVQRHERVELRYGAVPVVWHAVSPTEDAMGAARATGVQPPEIIKGSYFGGKQAWTAALLAELRRFDSDAMTRLDAQLEPLSTSVALDSRWGTIIMTPSEFGSDTELNDHSLQYGYWVAAASVMAEANPAWVAANRPLVDALIADYGGRNQYVQGPFSSYRTWGAYNGHSYASGLAPFADGNNLESTSEAMFAWWAAARWMTATGRAEAAKLYIARLTIESWVSRTRWLPDHSETGARPWTGVVWSAKADLGTFFDGRPEAALGIKLLPLGPNSLARYPDAASAQAAVARWRWCEANGGCGDLWPNLLDSDAAVAGRPQVTGPGEPERSTTAAAAQWWRELWQATPAPAEGVRCTPGAAARRDTAQRTVIIASNPAARPLAASCADERGRTVWKATIAPQDRVWQVTRG